MRDGTPPPSSFSPDWVEWPRRCTVPYPANLETRLEILFSTGCRPSPRVESRDLSKEIFAYRTVDAFSLYYHLSSIYYYLFFPSFYFLYILVFLSKFLKLLLIQYSSLLFSTRLKWRLKFPRFILIVFVLLLLLSLRNNICRKNTPFPISKMSILFSLFQMVS